MNALPQRHLIVIQLSPQSLYALTRAPIRGSAPPSWPNSLPHRDPQVDRIHCDLIGGGDDGDDDDGDDDGDDDDSDDDDDDRQAAE